MKERKDWAKTLTIGAAGKALVDCASLLPEPYALMARLVLIVIAAILIVKN